MDQLLEVTNVKSEPTLSTSSDRLEISPDMQIESVYRESDCLMQSDIHIKTEPEEDENEFAAVPAPLYQLCSNYDMKTKTDEPMIKIECEDVIDELIEDPLDFKSEIKVEKHFQIDLDQSESGIKTEQIEKQKEHLLKTDKGNSHGSRSNKRKNQLFIRNRSDRKVKQYICNECNKVFRQKCNLDDHLRIHTGEKPFTCYICKKSFNVRGTLDKHMTVHSDEKPYSCDVCKKVFKQKSHLNEHKLMHSSIKSFSCNECNKSFTHKQSLISHNRIHTGEKPFICNLCNKAFANKSNIIEHRRTHTGEKPYSCDICNKSFTQNSTLIEHKRLHTGEKPFSCNICNKSFTQKTNLNQHKKIHKK